MAAPFPSPTRTWHTNTYPSLSPTRPELSAKGKTVLITGGGTGIGAETARHFAAAGASRIALLGRREQPLLDTASSIKTQFPNIDIFTAPTDITNKTQVDSAFANFLPDKHQKLDILVTAAAVIGPQESIEDADDDKFMWGIDQNVQGALYVAKAFLRHAAASDAVVVEINSSAAHVNFAPAFVSYSVAKMAVYRLWDSVGFAHPDLSVFHLQPGVVDTDMNREAGGVKALGYEDHVSLPASFILWLASPEARFLKGKYLWANWDVDELKARSAEIEAGTELNVVLGGWPFDKKGWKSGWNS